MNVYLYAIGNVSGGALFQVAPSGGVGGGAVVAAHAPSGLESHGGDLYGIGSHAGIDLVDGAHQLDIAGAEFSIEEAGLNGFVGNDGGHEDSGFL